jgi:hypothetical protein
MKVSSLIRIDPIVLIGPTRFVSTIGKSFALIIVICFTSASFVN